MSVLVCICQDDCRCESNSTHHSVSMPPAGSTGCCLVQLLLPGEPASSGFTLTLKKQLISSDLHALTCKKTGQVICGERLKIHPRAKTTVFMDPCCDNQPSPSDCMTDGVFCRSTSDAGLRSELQLPDTFQAFSWISTLL